MSKRSNRPVEVFLSYSHEDKSLKDELLKHLGALRWDGQIVTWHDLMIEPGQKWPLEIELHLRRAEIILLLVSADFLGSEFCYNIEMRQALRRHATGKATVVPILLRPCDWRETPFGALQALPTGGKPIAKWSDRDDAFTDVAQGIRRLIEKAQADNKQPGEVPEVIIPRKSIRLAGCEFVFSPSGSFPMGSDNHYRHERPQHNVLVSAFFLAATPVTNAQFRAFVDQTSYVTGAEIKGIGMCLAHDRPVATKDADWKHPWGPSSTIEHKESHPVVQVNWHDALAFNSWMSNLSGYYVTFPTEAQWEYAAAGEEGNIWPFGNSYARNKANLEGTDTTQVGTFEPNALGAFDLAGNVYEWCGDWFAETWQQAGHNLHGVPITDPTGPRSGSDRVLKGGSWLDNAEHSRCANRMRGRPNISFVNWGMRCCLHLDDRLLSVLLSSKNWGLSAKEMLGTGA